MQNFIELADYLFPQENLNSIEEYFKQSNKIPKENGLYAIIKPDNVKFHIKNTPEGPDKYKGTPLILQHTENFDKYLNGNGKYLYIGKANSQNGINSRLSSYISFGYEVNDTKISHRGGFPLWFLDSNKKMLVTYITISNIKNKCPILYQAGLTIYKRAKEAYKKRKNKDLTFDDSEIMEACLTELHKNNYKGLLPFANCTKENTKIEYKTLWAEYWKNQN